MELKDLGLTKEEIFEHVTSKVAEQLLRVPTAYVDDDGNEQDDFKSTQFNKKLQEHIKAKIDSTIEAVVDKYVLPNAEQRIQNIVLHPTNQWGEKKNEPQTFVEYLTTRAERFMTEKVSFDGKVKGRDSYSWKANGTRIEFMIDRYLQYHIENWAKKALTEANRSIADGLEKAVKVKLQEVLEKLQVKATVK